MNLLFSGSDRQILDTTRKRPEKIDYLQYPESDVVVGHINFRFSKGLGTNVFVIGLSGTGKSSTSQRLGELINESRDNKYNVFIVDSLLSFVKAVRESVEGDIIVIEEVSVLFPSRRSMAQENVAMGAIFDTVRKKRLAIISNCPIWGSVDSHMRALGHLLIETLRVNKTQKIVISKFLRLQTNPMSGKTYFHTFQRDGRDIKMMYTRMPDKKKWDEYERQKEEFMSSLYSKLEAKQKKKEEKEDKKIRTIPEPKNIRKFTERELAVYQLFYKGKLTNQEVARKLGLCDSRVTGIRKNIEKKIAKGHHLEQLGMKTSKEKQTN